jgi:diguanylate cyclase (GGDEF)-like protein
LQEFHGIEKVAYIDELTGLGNLSSLKQIYGKRELNNLHFIFVDIDEFNKMNAIFGVDAVEDILVLVSEKLVEYCGNTTVFRVGPDQFILVTESHYICEPMELARILRQPIKHHKVQYLVNASICVLDYDDFSGVKLDRVLKLMRFSIDQVKNEKGNNLIYADEQLLNKYLEKKQIELEIFNAVQNQDFYPKYQPFVDTFNGSIIGFETVSRWNLGGIEIKPESFLTIAEYTGLIYEIEMFMFEETVKFFSELKADKSINLSKRFKASVNFSEHTIKRVFQEHLNKTISKYGINPNEIILEIREQIITKEETVEKIDSLRNRGFLIAIDEYNNKHSSLRFLANISVDILKLDSCLLERMDKEKEFTKMHCIYKFIVDISKNFDLTVVSSGINNKENLKLIKDLGINIGSGEIFSKGMLKEDFIDYIKNNKINRGFRK